MDDLKNPQPNSFRNGPDATGHFGIFGGRFVAETLMPLILDLEKAYEAAKADPSFQAELDHLAAHRTRLLGTHAGKAAAQASRERSG